MAIIIGSLDYSEVLYNLKRLIIETEVVLDGFDGLGIATFDHDDATIASVSASLQSYWEGRGVTF